MRTRWLNKRNGEKSPTQIHFARTGVVTEEMLFIARRETLYPELIREEVARGRMIIPANIHHTNLELRGSTSHPVWKFSESPPKTSRFIC